MTNIVFDAPKPQYIKTTTGALFPVRRIYCVGKNYAEHVAELGGDPATTLPVFFTKDRENLHRGGALPYPSATENLHFEAELVVALKSGGKNITAENALSHIYGYAAGCDLTRRDLQGLCKEKSGPWDIAKAFDNAAVCGAIKPCERMADHDRYTSGAIELSQNGEIRQQDDLSKMVWHIPNIIMHLSNLFELHQGDLIYTGTPKGVGQMVVGDQIDIEIADLPPVSFNLV